jgi:endonuclease-3 related protein
MNQVPLQKIYDDLFAQYGPQRWWPARTRAEMMIGAILTQNTAWTHVEKALINLRKHKALNFEVLAAAEAAQVAAWIRPAGYFNQKTRCLKALAALIAMDFSGSLNRLFRLDTPDLRKKLLAVKGIGPETADSILLYAAKRPVFVVDAYTRRLLAAHGMEKESLLPYDDVAARFTAQLPPEVLLYNEFHALIVRWGKDYSG